MDLCNEKKVTQTPGAEDFWYNNTWDPEGQYPGTGQRKGWFFQVGDFFEVENLSVRKVFPRKSPEKLTTEHLKMVFPQKNSLPTMLYLGVIC